MNRFFLASALAALVASAPIIALAGPNDGTGKAGRHRHARNGEDGGAKPGRAQFRRAMRHERRGLRMLKALELTDAQKALLADGRAAAEPIRQDLRAKIDALRRSETTPTDGQNRLELRKARREKVRALVDAARAQVEPSAAKFVGSLTAEQKTKLGELARKRGKTFDEAKFTKRVAGMFLMPKSLRRRGDR